MSQNEPQSPPPKASPDTPTSIGFVLLGLIAVVLLAPLLGFAKAPIWVVASLLLARIGVQFWRTRRITQQTGHAPRSAGSWILDVTLVGLLIWIGLNPK